MASLFLCGWQVLIPSRAQQGFMAGRTWEGAFRGVELRFPWKPQTATRSPPGRPDVSASALRAQFAGISWPFIQVRTGFCITLLGQSMAPHGGTHGLGMGSA